LGDTFFYDNVCSEKRSYFFFTKKNLFYKNTNDKKKLSIKQKLKFPSKVLKKTTQLLQFCRCKLVFFFFLLGEVGELKHKLVEAMLKKLFVV